MAIDFVVHSVGGDRTHYVGPDDVRVVLSRLPSELYARLRAVHFADRSRGGHRFGYVTTRGRRDITLCALPPRIRPPWPETFGAQRHRAWPWVAVRRFMLYEVLLHEIGHLQIARPSEQAPRRRYADETLAHEFAARWRETLWATPFDHPDPAHRPASFEERGRA